MYINKAGISAFAESIQYMIVGAKYTFVKADRTDTNTPAAINENTFTVTATDEGITVEFDIQPGILGRISKIELYGVEYDPETDTDKQVTYLEEATNIVLSFDNEIIHQKVTILVSATEV